jgi:hypothetical protein
MLPSELVPEVVATVALDTPAKDEPRINCTDPVVIPATCFTVAPAMRLASVVATDRSAVWPYSTTDWV